MNVATRYRIGGAAASEVAASVERGIREGGLLPGTTLPTVRGLAARLELSPTTVAAAYRTLRARGLVTGAGRRGTRVSARPAVLPRPASPLPRGLRDVYSGNPDPVLLPAVPLRHRRPTRSRLYGEPAHLPELVALARRRFLADGVPEGPVAVLGGGMDSLERVFQAHLRPGDRVAVEDPGFTGVLDLLGALGLLPEPVALDAHGLRPDSLERALQAGARAVVATPRAQNPTGAAFDDRRARALRGLLHAWPDVLLIEDDHAADVAGVPLWSLLSPGRARWAAVRSVSKSLSPDYRVALVTGDETTVARVEGRQALGAGWVSHVLQRTVAAVWSDPGTPRALARAAAAYAERRAALVSALAGEGVAAAGASGLNVWIPVHEEGAVVTALAAAGWAVRAGEPYRIQSPPAVRVTVSALRPPEAPRLAAALARAAGRGARGAAPPRP